MKPEQHIFNLLKPKVGIAWPIVLELPTINGQKVEAHIFPPMVANNKAAKATAKEIAKSYEKAIREGI